MSKFRGIYSPICTPFSRSDQSIDEGSLRRLIDFQLENGVHGIIPCGGTGEFAALSHEERKWVTETTVNQVAGPGPGHGPHGRLQHLGSHRAEQACRGRRVRSPDGRASLLRGAQYQ